MNSQVHQFALAPHPLRASAQSNKYPMHPRSSDDARVSEFWASMNDVGVILGWSRTITAGSGNPKAVVWENYQSPAATDLNLKIPIADRPNWLLQYATAINSSGQIVGYGLKNGGQRAFMLTPLP